MTSLKKPVPDYLVREIIDGDRKVSNTKKALFSVGINRVF
jgi:hypothetical protein